MFGFSLNGWLCLGCLYLFVGSVDLFDRFVESPWARSASSMNVCFSVGVLDFALGCWICLGCFDLCAGRVYLFDRVCGFPLGFVSQLR